MSFFSSSMASCKHILTQSCRRMLFVEICWCNINIMCTMLPILEFKLCYSPFVIIGQCWVTWRFVIFPHCERLHFTLTDLALRPLYFVSLASSPAPPEALFCHIHWKQQIYIINWLFWFYVIWLKCPGIALYKY